MAQLIAENCAILHKHNLLHKFAEKMNTMKKEITHEELPQAMSYLIAKVEKLEADVSNIIKKKVSGIDNKEWMNIIELCDYLPTHPARQTVYEWVKARTIPHHKTSKMLTFNKSEIDLWLHGGYRKTVREIESDADDYINSKNK